MTGPARKTDAVTIAASIALTLVLLSSMGFTVFASDATTRAVNRATAARALSISYANVRYALAAEESLGREYRLEPRVGVARGEAAAAREFASVMETIARTSPPELAAEAHNVLKLHARYVGGVRRMFAAVDARDAARARHIDLAETNPLFSAIASAMSARLIEQRRIATAIAGRLEATQRYVVHAAVALSTLGLVSLFGFLFVIWAYRSRLIAAHAAEVRRIEDASLLDSLTKIGNHRAFKNDIQRELARAGRERMPLTLAIFDVDEFKNINDRNGHVHGDRVLAELAGVLDSGRSGDRAYRIGGDEFALVLPNASAAAARLILERVRLAASHSLHGGTVSIGYATVDGSDMSAETLQQQADDALYLSKRRGRNAVSRFDALKKATSAL